MLNPTVDQMKDAELDLVVAGTAEGVLMVESEARELTEDVMLGAVTFGHQHFQPVIQAIIELAEHAAKEPWALPEPRRARARWRSASTRWPRRRSPRPTRRATSRPATSSVAAAKKEAAAALTGEGLDAGAAKGLFKDLEADIVRNAILDTGLRIDGRDTKTVRPIVGRGRHPAARPWLRAVHPRRDPGARGRDARHRPGRADDRRARGRVPREFHAALQLPALLGGRGRPHGLAGPARDRPRQAGLARDPSAAARTRRSSPTRCAWSARSPKATAPPRWRRSAAPRSR